jgi:soluble lytic murein transglycosylase
MTRGIRRLIWILLLAAALAAAWVLWRSNDPLYRAQEWMHGDRYRRWDRLIHEAASEYGVDPMLIKAVIWRESEFVPDKAGSRGERGLMQVTEGAASDWARVNGVANFASSQLYDPRTNIRVGAWYLRQAMDRWSERDDPVPFALAEYNAGKSRVDRWIVDTNMGATAKADDLRESITFPTTRAYVEAILARYYYYKERGRM